MKLTLNKCVFGMAAVGLTLYAGTKHPLMTTAHAPQTRAPAPQEETPAAPPPLQSVLAWPQAWFEKPVGASSFTPWSQRGAIEDWAEINVGPYHYVALPNGVLRTSPREWTTELGLESLGLFGAVPGISELWWTQEDCGTCVVTWENFLSSISNKVNFCSVQIRLDADGYSLCTSASIDPPHAAYNPVSDQTLDLSLTAPEGVFVEGERRPLSLACASEREIVGRLRLSQTAGEDLISLWTASNGGVRVSLPVSFDAATFQGVTYFVQAESSSAHLGDIAFTASLVGEGPNPGVRTATDTMTAVEILRIDVASDAQGRSATPPPFEPGFPAYFDVTRSVTPDRHLVIPFCHVADASLAVSNFTIDAEVVVTPEGYSESVSWERIGSTPEAGTLARARTFTPQLIRPTEGGVYLFEAKIGGVLCGWTVVLPLASPEIEPTILHDLQQADAFVAWAHERFPDESNMAGRVLFGLNYFCLIDNGYYRGRPDTNDPQHKTVWEYNQINDDGLGAVASLARYPTRLEKMSNLLCAYTCEKLGVTTNEQAIAQLFGTQNDPTAQMSWNAGVTLAHTFAPTLVLPTLASNMWVVADTKARKLWPNTAFPDNYQDEAVVMTNFDWLFFSPGFLLFGL